MTAAAGKKEKKDKTGVLKIGLPVVFALVAPYMYYSI